VKNITVVITAILLAGCQSMHTPGESSVWFKVKPGSKLVLNKALEIPSGQAHVVLQKGAVTGAVDQYTINCSFEGRSPGPQTINPDSFLIANSSNQQEWVSRPDTMNFYKVFRLKSAQQPDVEKLVCSYWDGAMAGKPVTVKLVRKALGEYVTFEFAP
jgi:hypothetical protein